MRRFFTVILLVLMLQIQVFAQEIPQGTLVVVQPSKTIDADDVKLGDNVSFTTIKPVKVNGNVVLKQGIEVNAKVTKRKNNGILGIPGEIKIGEFNIVTQENEIIHLSGTISDKGEGRYWANVGWIFVFPLLFVKGNDGKIYTNTTHLLYTAEDFDI